MPISELPRVMALCLILTILMEVGAALILRVRAAGDLRLILLANLLTNPPLNVLLAICSVCWGTSVRHGAEVVLEIAVVLGEGLIYRHTLRWKGNPFLLSLLLNGVSFWLGKVLGAWIF